MFQSTRLHEAWPSCCYRYNIYTQFQSTRLHEAWQLRQELSKTSVKFQSTRLHEAWLTVMAKVSGAWIVSIHTPAWGVTYSNHKLCIFRVVSIHTPAWGVTGILILILFRPLMFQSTRLHEAWRSLNRINFTFKCFNPHACMRRDQTWDIGIAISTMFQSTRLHEAWHKSQFKAYNNVSVSIHTPAWGVTWFMVT